MLPEPWKELSGDVIIFFNLGLRLGLRTYITVTFSALGLPMCLQSDYQTMSTPLENSSLTEASRRADANV